MSYGHDVCRVIGGTSHVARFIGGGELRYACDDHGRSLDEVVAKQQYRLVRTF